MTVKFLHIPETLLHCCLCQSILEDPRVLPCGHMICNTHINQLKNAEQSKLKDSFDIHDDQYELLRSRISEIILDFSSELSPNCPPPTDLTRNRTFRCPLCRTIISDVNSSSSIITPYQVKDIADYCLHSQKNHDENKLSGLMIEINNLLNQNYSNFRKAFNSFPNNYSSMDVKDSMRNVKQQFRLLYALSIKLIDHIKQKLNRLKKKYPHIDWTFKTTQTFRTAEECSFLLQRIESLSKKVSVKKLYLIHELVNGLPIIIEVLEKRKLSSAKAEQLSQNILSQMENLLRRLIGNATLTSTDPNRTKFNIDGNPMKFSFESFQKSHNELENSIGTFKNAPKLTANSPYKSVAISSIDSHKKLKNLKGNREKNQNENLKQKYQKRKTFEKRIKAKSKTVFDYIYENMILKDRPLNFLGYPKTDNFTLKQILIENNIRLLMEFERRTIILKCIEEDKNCNLEQCSKILEKLLNFLEGNIVTKDIRTKIEEYDSFRLFCNKYFVSYKLLENGDNSTLTIQIIGEENKLRRLKNKFDNEHPPCISKYQQRRYHRNRV
ncbi:hypothetical protein SNEBB_001452 [Seison nebaliae]|nr:hypothetical protein SNEBB_001452 [Seison nebaliae]